MIFAVFGLKPVLISRLWLPILDSAPLLAIQLGVERLVVLAFGRAAKALFLPVPLEALRLVSQLRWPLGHLGNLGLLGSLGFSRLSNNSSQEIGRSRAL